MLQYFCNDLGYLILILKIKLFKMVISLNIYINIYKKKFHSICENTGPYVLVEKIKKDLTDVIGPKSILF